MKWVVTVKWMRDAEMGVMQGAGQSSFVTAWGDGFVTDPTILSANGLSDPRPFFDTLSTKPYLGRVSAMPTASAGDPVPHVRGI